MAFVLADFRAAFPEFSITSEYPDAMVNYWAGYAARQLVEERWRNLYDDGLNLATAHYLTIAGRNSSSANAGNVGVVNSKSVGSMSVGYDSASANIDGAGDWNATSYGKEFYKLLRRVGTGVVVI